MRRFMVFAAIALAGLALFLTPSTNYIDASSHREAPLIANDPVADNADLWVFRSPDDPNSVTIVASYIGLELPEGGPNWTTFAEGVRYEIHIKNKTSSAELGAAKDDITYRFTFSQINEDPTTFFNIRLGKQNLKTTYKCEKSTDGGVTFTTIVSNGIVPPNYIGPRSFAGSPAGLGKPYTQVVQEAINTSSPTGEKMLVGPFDDPFFVDLGGVFDLGQTRTSYGNDPNNPNFARDAVAGFNVHAIVMNVPIARLQKDAKTVSQAANILDPDFVIGVWAASSRQQVTTLSNIGAKPVGSGPWTQVSRLGMPLVNEAIIPIGLKDKWNAVTPYSKEEQDFIVPYFVNPELALYMDISQFGDAIPALSALRVQSRSYPAIGVIPTYTTPGFDFRNGKDGAFAATKIPGISFTGTAFALNSVINVGLVAAGQPRTVDFYPIFYFGVPNLIPYQLATGKTAGPLSDGKPFVHNFLPLTVDSKGKIYGGDVLRLNMATPVTPRNTAEYRVNARMGLIRAAAIGLTAPPFNTNKNLEFIPHMDGFPNGRRLEDDVTTIELQATGGLVLAAVGLPFDDAVAGNYADLASARLVAELTYNAGPTANDLPLTFTFPYLALPHNGYSYVKQLTAKGPVTSVSSGNLNIGVPKAFVIEQNYPNPFNPSTEIKYHISTNDVVKLRIFNQLGQVVTTLFDKPHAPGTYSVVWDAKDVPTGTYYYRLEVGEEVFPAKKALLVK